MSKKFEFTEEQLEKLGFGGMDCRIEQTSIDAKWEPNEAMLGKITFSMVIKKKKVSPHFDTVKDLLRRGVNPVPVIQEQLAEDEKKQPPKEHIKKWVACTICGTKNFLPDGVIVDAGIFYTSCTHCGLGVVATSWNIRGDIIIDPQVQAKKPIHWANPKTDLPVDDNCLFKEVLVSNNGIDWENGIFTGKIKDGAKPYIALVNRCANATMGYPYSKEESFALAKRKPGFAYSVRHLVFEGFIDPAVESGQTKLPKRPFMRTEYEEGN